MLINVAVDDDTVSSYNVILHIFAQRKYIKLNGSMDFCCCFIRRRKIRTEIYARILNDSKNLKEAYERIQNLC